MTAAAWLKVENISLLYSSNSSNMGNSSLLGEFPYWQPTLAISLFFNIAVPSGIVFFLYLPLLVVLLRLLKKEQLKTLSLIHVSLLVASILDDFLRICLYSIYLPSALRYCVCSSLMNATLSAEYIFFLIYWPLTFACLSVLQFLVVIGKKFVSIKLACGMVALCVGISSVCVTSVLRQFYETDKRLMCYISMCPESALVNTAVIFFSLSLVAILPSLAVAVTSTWSCAVFKTYYTGRNDQLNRRILSLPFLMPLVIIASSVFEGALGASIAHVMSMLSLGDLLPYWIIFTSSVLFSILRLLIWLPYPLVLLYTRNRLCQAMRELLNRPRKETEWPPISKLEHFLLIVKDFSPMNSTIVRVTQMDSESAKVALTCNWGSPHKEMSYTNMYIFAVAHGYYLYAHYNSHLHA